ncbi:YfiR family protein [Caulobacter sp.]|uniref:YfiR family protein n=1 Tax=Caulobacter sp. TaxID=78 RepID=UPI002B494A73|nr:YfiR family protein [Caulobacter sp.]HJV40292.1 YfiR family protein [Caulobacter sp.]
MLCALNSVAMAGDRGGWRGASAVKAGYLSKFPPFTAWPETAFENVSSPFRLCVAGSDPFGPILDRATRGRRVGEHPMVVTRLPSVAKGADCHMLFVSTSRVQTPRQMLAAVAGRPVLTVADEMLDAPDAMIQFVTVEGRVRFVIRAEAVQAEGLILSSKLLSLSTPQRGAR